ncbi:Amt family ammonium transporter [Lewinella marina]|uniref:Ammonium transporter n=1 Tax=Neolewinella marina TaxID=438751 RepID=A0A2G0CCW2_9BACT|nr:ammonium transporter [Neolewinella marina]NJB87551.1 Amt family ammonium transporter [Neolewinella marina]PHK97770.1 ammonium transporter [Neolewinella marina]
MEALFTVNNLWILVATCLVFIMHLGFATLEAGFVQRKNVVNILFKNSMIISIGLLTYYFIGYNLMYPGDDYAGGVIGAFGVMDWAAGVTPDYAAAAEAGDTYTGYSDFIFQAMFAATCATIVSGAVAERIKLVPFLIFATLFVALSYPITGMWQWGGGWLASLQTPFYDFAGSTLVHAAGGFAALAAIILLGSRRGKYRSDGTVTAIPGHSMPLAAIGVFLLWFGWFGFNGGSVLSADPNGVSLVFVTTSLAAAAGGVAAFFMGYVLFKSYDLSMVLNGILGGLVGITAGADLMSGGEAIVIGLIAGTIIPLSIVFFDKTLRLDDPVGATSVHGVCGIWGTLAVGLFGASAGFDQFITQLIGTLAVGAFSFASSFMIFSGLKAVMGIRVDEEEEIRGLDVGEHDMHAYSLTKEDGVFQLTSE